MKINVNYDFIDKAIEAKKEFSLKRYAFDTLVDASDIISCIGCVGLVGSLILSPAFSISMLYPSLSLAFPFAAIGNAIPYIATSKDDKEFIKWRLGNLAEKLNAEGIKTNADLLMQSRVYQTKYHLDFSSSIIPELVKTRHILVPVENDENTAKLLVQEHVVGTHSYTLSYDEPAKQKVYSRVRSV